MKTIEQLIDDALQPKPRQRSGKFSPSSFGQCYRQQYWNRKNETKSNPADSRSLRVFAAGQLFHDFVQGVIMSNGQKFEKEVCVDTQPDILGFADLVGENEVIDIKSQHSKSFWWMNKKNADIKKEKYGNWLQVMYYATELKKDFARLVFVSKDDLCIQEYVQPCDYYWQEELRHEIFNLQTIWDEQKLPPALPRCEKKKDGTYWMCEYCNFYDLCVKIEKQEDRVHPNEA